MLLRVHQFLPLSYANGPGARAVLWVQGCTLGCPGCFNVPTHPAAEGEITTVAALFEQIIALGSAIEGVTISGGEPLQQQEAVGELLRRIRAETSLSTILFTGFSWEELEKMGVAQGVATKTYPLPLLADVDILIAGRYVAEKRIARDLRGSSNKMLYLLSVRYSEQEMQAVPEAEIVISQTGEIMLSGIDPLRW
jgi:anaerobic ribonucleoside-triphosphate reductase activating protein